ncbi:MAG: hypothetical protein LH603_11310 [Pseudonocardia sp.]|nr:hypothetical protein [Pseudonocardia sp.]
MSAPAGYGKTLLLAEWAAARPSHTAWVSLDEDDNDDHRFWASVLTAVGSCAVVDERGLFDRIHIPAAASADADFLAAVLDACDRLPESIRLVLDDVHELTAPGPLHGLGFLVRNRSPGVRLVLAGRIDPPLPVARLRLAGELCEVRAHDLVFSPAEAADMFAAAQVSVRPDQVRLLIAQTEGWPAGLRLAALSLRGSSDVEGLLSDLVGNSTAISDYLVEEILSRMAPEVRLLLRSVSICDQLSVELAAALSDRSDAGELLDALEQETALVLRSGAGPVRYRVHPLLRSHLHADLHRQRPDLVAELHRRAAAWFAEQLQPVRALNHARQAADRAGVARLLRRHGVALVSSGQHAAVRTNVSWLGEHVGADAWFVLVAALAARRVGASRRPPSTCVRPTRRGRPNPVRPWSPWPGWSDRGTPS